MASITQLYAKKYRVCYLHKDAWTVTEDTYASIDEFLVKNLDAVKNSVLDRGWDYVAIVSGIPGVGKSTFAQRICKYLDPTFNTKDRICFTGTGKNGLIERTAHAKLGQAYMLDESFADLNTKVSKGSEFVKIMNHLQLIRQKGLYLVLCLPNFFDLSKGIAVFRSSHLFAIYSDGFERGYFAAFGRDEKRELYVKGSKFMDYNVRKPNFRGTFSKQWFADQELYDKLKLQHLQEQAKEAPKGKDNLDRKALKQLFLALKQENYTNKELYEMSGVSKATFYRILDGEGSVNGGEEG